VSSPRSIFVTGAAQGIGRATAELFVQRGWRVGACDIDDAKLAGLPWARRVDVTKPDELLGAIDAFASDPSGGGLDVMFNNAGVLSMGTFHEMPVDKLVRLVDVNVRGAMLGARAALPHLVKSKGVLVSMGSASGIYGTADIAAYSATKFFVRGLTEALDVELAGTGVRVVDVMPAFVDTDMVRKDQQGSTSVAKLGVHLTPTDIAEQVWRIANEPVRGHVIPQLKMRMFSFVAGLSPSLARALAKGNR
jgi:NAD(P)-dependent dehydrogenase (short-subunit alcohol dehydrogenase family)